MEGNTEGEKGTTGNGVYAHTCLPGAGFLSLSLPVGNSGLRGQFRPRQTGIVCASKQTTWAPECQVLVSSKFREGSFIPRQTGIACASEQQTKVTSANLATVLMRPNPSTVQLPAPSHRAVCVHPARSSAARACEGATDMPPPASQCATNSGRSGRHGTVTGHRIVGAVRRVLRHRSAAAAVMLTGLG